MWRERCSTEAAEGALRASIVVVRFRNFANVVCESSGLYMKPAVDMRELLCWAEIRIEVEMKLGQA